VYIVLKSILFTERKNLWIGLAKETAHQMGTPITSLIGWLDYLKLECTSYETDFSMDYDNLDIDEDTFPNTVSNIASDMERDVTRLRKVANRFEQIGSVPSLKKGSIKTLLEEHTAYFSKRVPVLGRKVKLELEILTDLPRIYFNSDLLSWVFENLFKNSLDAMDKTEGSIVLTAQHVKVDNILVITHRDNGCGVGKERKHTVFAPGYTTKKRGWGLGLALARRIINTFHKGKIYISWTKKDEGTEFRIELPVEAESATGKEGVDET
jgi:signal transduction histidine kinase